jgi:hypothetical protein
MIKIAHRGVSGHRLENTSASFKKAEKTYDRSITKFIEDHKSKK